MVPRAAPGAAYRVPGRRTVTRRPPAGPGGEVQGSGVGADDAVHDRQAEADTGVLVGAHAVRPAPEGFGERREQLR